MVDARLLRAWIRDQLRLLFLGASMDSTGGFQCAYHVRLGLPTQQKILQSDRARGGKELNHNPMWKNKAYSAVAFLSRGLYAGKKRDASAATSDLDLVPTFVGVVRYLGLPVLAGSWLRSKRSNIIQSMEQLK